MICLMLYHRSLLSSGGHSDKAIGYYATVQSLTAAAQHAAEQPGFRDQREAFRVMVLELDWDGPVADCDLSVFLAVWWREFALPTVLWGVGEMDWEGDSERLLGLCRTREQADEMAMRARTRGARDVEVSSVTVGRSGWLDGFVRE